ncbi:DUF1214 domain-containing protein [Streptomyces sp. NPDC059875]|uniref:DUF1214 domain-containing protein n=1 Tax=unclassified Streptomyces TaxID=2593676 RepID=UPI0036619F6A
MQQPTRDEARPTPDEAQRTAAEAWIWGYPLLENYRLPERLLVDNPIDRYSIGDRTPGLVYDDDGGLTLYVQQTRPGDPEHAANWLPAPDGPFTIALGVYGPDPSVLNGGWSMPRLAVNDT